MTDTPPPAEDTVPAKAASMTPEEAFKILETKAHMLMQVYRDLDKANGLLRGFGSSGDKNSKIGVRDYDYYQSPAGGYTITHRGRDTSVYPEGSDTKLDATIKKAEEEINQLRDKIGSIFELVRDIRMDKRVLKAHEADVLITLPQELKEAKEIFDATIKCKHADANLIDTLADFKRHSNFLDSFSKEIGDAGKVLVEYNTQAVNRKGGVLTKESEVEDITARHEASAAARKESRDYARKFSPPLRKYEGKRKEHWTPIKDRIIEERKAREAAEATGQPAPAPGGASLG